jgi:GDPmannose 4,6-dehydratase
MPDARKTALITGITGQDGSYLAELLIDKGYAVHGIVRRSSSDNTWRIDHLLQTAAGAGAPLQLHHGDLADALSLHRIVQATQPDEVYNLGAMSHVAVSFENPEYTADIDAVGTLRLLESIRGAGLAGRTRFYQASTSELFGRVRESPQSETTPFHPRSPYGVAKVYGHHITVNYRESYGLFAVSGILFNHESPRRGVEFVTRKITRAVARIDARVDHELRLGNLDARRDWGFAGDFVEAMWLMLQADTPNDYVVATGETHSVREFCELAFARVGLDWKRYVVVDESLLRPAEVEFLCGDASRARRELGWSPRLDFKGLVECMVDADVAALTAGR